MTNRSSLIIAVLVAVAGLICVTPATAGEPAGDEQKTETALPEAVSEFVGALSGVVSVEPVEADGENRFAVHRRIDTTGSRVKRAVTMVVDEHGTVVDWGQDPSFLRSSTLSELRDTGRSDLAQALADLDPSIQTHGGG